MSEVYKTFGTILKDNKYVRFQSTKYKQIKKPFTKTLPLELNPIKQWANLLDSVKNQGKCGCCFAIATAGALVDRLTIMTLGQFFEGLSPYQMIMCQGTIIPQKYEDEYLKEINNQAHSNGACNGGSLYTAMDFLYCIGLTSEKCVNYGEFEQYNIKKLEDIKSSEEVPNCYDIMTRDYDTCLDRKTAARYYRIIAGYSVDSDIESIKQEIYKWGPVVSGFNVYSDFLKYNGTDIYMGPKEESQKLGGHAIKIMGWGNENGVDFWWICNSWGTGWGLSGYFKMKMNIPECELETNVVAFIPDLPGFKTEYLSYEIKLDPNDVFLRSWFNVNQKTGFRYIAIDKIKKGELKGNLDQSICKYTPDFENMWVGEMSPEDVSQEYIKLAQYNEKYNISIWFILFLFLCSYLLGKVVKRLMKKNK
jgi:cathepsin B